jgi:hypothetical protein
VPGLSAPTPPLRDAVAAGLVGAFWLARGRRDGIRVMDGSAEGAWRSFVAAAICVPAFLALRFLSWSVAPPDGNMGRALAAETIGYLVAWFGFALLSLPVATAWGKAALWPRFVTAFNWSNVVQYLVLLALTLPGALGLPSGVSQVLTLLALGYAVWLEWYVVRVSLELDGGRAAALVAMDLAVGLFVGGMVQRLSEG